MVNMINEIPDILSTTFFPAKNPPVWGEIGRALVAEDMVMLKSTPLGVKTPDLQNIRASHHHLARLLATGMKAVEVSACTGFSQSRISILKKDPGFDELLTHYANNEDSRHAQIAEVLKSLSLDALAEVRERVLDNPEEIGIKTLLQIAEMSLDRSGNGPSSSVAVGVGILSQEDMNAIKDSQNKSKIYSKAERLQDHSGSADCGADVDGTRLGAKTVEGITIKGEDL